MKTNQLFDYIHNEIFGKELMEKASQVDTNANGVQIEGNGEINKVAIGVSCNYEFLEKAKGWGANACIFHHGLGLTEKYGYVVNSKLIPSTQKQLKLIFENNMTIAGYHYLLDSHSEIGNNAQIISKLTMKNTGETYFDGWGYIGEFGEEKDLNEFAQECGRFFHHDIMIIKGGKDKIKRVGVISGGAYASGKAVFEIREKNLDLHLSGEIIEAIPAIAKDSGFNVFCCGHYATEIFGIKTLGEKINEKFPELDVRFIDVWNEI